MKQYKVLVSYNRSGKEGDLYQTINIMADNKQDALNLINNYEIEGLFDNLEDDYTEDTLHAIRIL